MTFEQTDVLHPGAATPIVRNVQESDYEMIHMREHNLERLDGDHRWRMIICREGTVWITQERDWRDYVLTPGDAFIVTQRGQVLIEALQDARVEVTPSLRTAPYAGALPVFH
jgi:hypothetical protein